MKSDDETAKLALMEEETRCEDEETTSMEDESDTDSGRAWSVDTEDDEVVRLPRINYLNMQDPEPEWDVDSFDGYECYDSEDRKSFSDEEEYEEFRVFKIQTWKNRGFLEDPFRSIYAIVDLEDIWSDRITVTTREHLANIASLCVKKLNEEKGSSVEVVSIVRANLKPGGGYKLYITFMAREHPDGPLVEYQAKAMDFAGGRKPTFPILCRPASSISSHSLQTSF
ncbi:Cystatin/monellin superfamily protein [Raphanus sativus]|nr:Cystatin/monellin superfamily protein [Raphanus sativus]